MERKAFFSKPAVYYLVALFAVTTAGIIYMAMYPPRPARPVVNEAAPAKTYQEFDDLRLNFMRTYPVIPLPPAGTFIPFAYSYHIDLATIRTMLDAGAYSVKISNGLDASRGKVFILTPVNSNYLEMVGQNYLCTAEKLCPTFCDRTVGAASRAIPSTDAKLLRDNYYNIPVASRDFYTSFVITKRALDGLRAQPSTVNLRAYHLLNGTARMVGVIGTDAEGFNITSLVYLQDYTTLCPSLCD